MATDMMPGVVSGVVTGLLLVLFVAGCVWAFSPRRRSAFDAAARLPLGDDGAGPEPARSAAMHPDAVQAETGFEQGDVR